MKGFGLIITLKDDVVFSERNATEGSHSTLDYIPGSALLGVAASYAYPEDAQEAFTLFHSGKVRFLNGYPLTSQGEISTPVPSCWHEAKGKSAFSGEQIDADKVWNLGRGLLPNNQQPKQLRAGYVSTSGVLVPVHKSMRMKTAIDAEKGRAKEAALFGYEALKAGQRFYAQVHLDNDISDTVLERLKQCFSQFILLGRSRSAEYGKAKIDIVDLEGATQKISATNYITLWLQSDLFALDEQGQPTLAPTANQLGLPNGKFLLDKSFLRTRRYSVWNAYKCGYEMERHVISKGSVLAYELDAPLTDTYIEKIKSGLGTERTSGLGQVRLNDALLENKQPAFNKKPCHVFGKISCEVVNPKTPLIQWLESQQNQDKELKLLIKQAKQVAKSYPDALQSARDLKGLDRHIPIGPSQSQWGSVAAIAKSNQSLNSIFSNEGACKPNGSGWQDELWDVGSGKVISFYSWFKNHCSNIAELDRRFVQHLVREIQAEINKQGANS